jgi:hypothetical protein
MDKAKRQLGLTDKSSQVLPLDQACSRQILLMSKPTFHTAPNPSSLSTNSVLIQLWRQRYKSPSAFVTVGCLLWQSTGQ